MTHPFAKLIITFYPNGILDEGDDFNDLEKEFYKWWGEAELITDPENLRVEFDSE